MDLPLGVTVVSGAVVLDDVGNKIHELWDNSGMLHKLLFCEDLVITSGKDGKHVAGSLHELGRAVDVRTTDKSPEMVSLFVHLLSYAAGAQPLAYFDERHKPGGPHLHIEWLGA